MTLNKKHADNGTKNGTTYINGSLFYIENGNIIGSYFEVAPGCLNHKDDFCKGKRIIKNLSITPEINCLHIRVNNCNDGLIIVENRCLEEVSIGKISPFPNRGEFKFDFNPIETVSYDNRFFPENDTYVSVNGTYNSNPFTISYIKTGPLCS